MLDKVVAALLKFAIDWFAEESRKADFKKRIAAYRAVLDELEASGDSDEEKNKKLDSHVLSVLYGMRNVKTK